MLTELGSTTMLDKALDTLPGVQKIIIEDAFAEGHADDDLGVAVAADQLAYIYFHRLHRRAQGGDASTPACSTTSTPRSTTWGWVRRAARLVPDRAASLRHLAVATGVGAPGRGRTLIVEQEVILDVARYVDTIVRGRVGVLQVVPSYLEVVLTYLEQHPRRFPTCGACRPPARR